jgi:hypothetical protein
VNERVQKALVALGRYDAAKHLADDAAEVARITLDTCVRAMDLLTDAELGAIGYARDAHPSGRARYLPVRVADEDSPEGGLSPLLAQLLDDHGKPKRPVRKRKARQGALFDE